MAGKRRKYMKSLAERSLVAEQIAAVEEEEEEETLELQSWSDLPAHLLEVIVSGLALKENIRVSAVCKSWHSVAVSMRMSGHTPWLMHFPESGNLYQFYDPSRRKFYFVEITELDGAEVCYSKDGWLLLYQPTTPCVFFFNPFTRQVIKLPRLLLAADQVIAFSCAPTSPACVVFTITHVIPMTTAIRTCYPGATQWTTTNCRDRFAWCPTRPAFWNNIQIAFSRGLFYCLNHGGLVRVFDPKKHTWTVLNVPVPPKWPERKFVAEYEGEIFVICTSCSESPILYKLDQKKMVWNETTTLGGVSLFASIFSSHSAINLPPGIMRNSIYFPKVRFYGKRCISYSLDDRRYYPRKQSHDWGELQPFDDIWIEPPQDFSSFEYCW